MYWRLSFRKMGLTERMFVIIMGTYVRVMGKKEQEMRSTMAFGCVLYLKDECDGCGMCEEERRRRYLYDEEALLDEIG